MTITKTYKQEIIVLFALIAITWLILVNTLPAPIFSQSSKIEEGVIVQKNDSVTTIIIPDKR